MFPTPSHSPLSFRGLWRSGYIIKQKNSPDNKCRGYWRCLARLTRMRSSMTSSRVLLRKTWCHLTWRSLAIRRRFERCLLPPLERGLRWCLSRCLYLIPSPRCVVLGGDTGFQARPESPCRTHRRQRASRCHHGSPEPKENLCTHTQVSRTYPLSSTRTSRRPRRV